MSAGWRFALWMLAAAAVAATAAGLAHEGGGRFAGLIFVFGTVFEQCLQATRGKR